MSLPTPTRSTGYVVGFRTLWIPISSPNPGLAQEVHAGMYPFPLWKRSKPARQQGLWNSSCRAET